MDHDEEAKAGQVGKKIFEIEPLEERVAPSVVVGTTGDHGPWVESGGGRVFLGHDPI